MTAAGILYQAGDKVLLMKRRDGSANGGTWAFPAGSIEDGESDFDAATREFREETGHTLSGDCIGAAVGENFGDFTLFKAQGDEFDPTLCDEHTEYMWATRNTLPTPLHPGILTQLGLGESMDEAEQISARREDINGYITIPRNPVSRSGVFKYLGRSIGATEPDKIYNVYRPPEEIGNPETIESFKLLPIINEHEMLGKGYAKSVEEKGSHGTTGDEVFFENGVLYANIRIFSNTLKSLIDSGKTGLSMGYRCVFEKSSGVIDGITYDYIQRKIRGNHLALVEEGRCDVNVLDHTDVFDHFDLALDSGEKVMADDKNKGESTESVSKSDSIAEKEPEITLAMVTKWAKQNVPQFRELEAALATETDDEDDSTGMDGDTEEKDGDTKEAKDKAAKDAMEKKDCEDEDEKKKEKDAMDAKEIKSRLSAVEKRGTKEILAEITSRDKLVKELSPIIGSFAHDAMDANDVTTYALKKLNLEAKKGQEQAVLTGFLAGRKASNGNVAFAMDAKVKTGGLLDKRLNKNA